MKELSYMQHIQFGDALKMPTLFILLVKLVNTKRKSSRYATIYSLDRFKAYFQPFLFG